LFLFLKLTKNINHYKVRIDPFVVLRNDLILKISIFVVRIPSHVLNVFPPSENITAMTTFVKFSLLILMVHSSYAQVRDNTLVVADSKTTSESFFYLRDSVIISELTTFNVSGTIYGREPSSPLIKFNAHMFDRDHVAFFKGESSVVLLAANFRADSHRLEYIINTGYLYKIDGHPYWGIDGKTPRRKIDKIKVVFNGQQVLIPHSAYFDLFEPNLCRRSIFGKMNCDVGVYASHDGRRLYIHMENGTIPNLYEVTLIIIDGKYRGRVVDFAY
jgi:hypothetical protein